MNKLSIAFFLMAGVLVELHAVQDVTFQVNMQNQTVSPNGVHVAGNWQSEAGLANGDWQPNTALMTDDDGDGIYAFTCTLPNGVYEYKFINGNEWGADESQIPVICQVGGGNENRFFVVDNSAVATIPVEFNGSAAFDAGIAFRPMRFTVQMPDLDPIDPNGVFVTGSFML